MLQGTSCMRHRVGLQMAVGLMETQPSLSFLVYSFGTCSVMHASVWNMHLKPERNLKWTQIGVHLRRCLGLWVDVVGLAL